MGKIEQKILIIDDDPLISKILKTKLLYEGFSVEVLKNGEGLLPFLEKNKFSLILCDLMMPKVDGFEVLKIIKENKIKIPIIILSNLSKEEDEKNTKELGAVDYLVKSNTPLLKIVNKIKEKLSN